MPLKKLALEFLQKNIKLFKDEIENIMQIHHLKKSLNLKLLFTLPRQLICLIFM